MEPEPIHIDESPVKINHITDQANSQKLKIKRSNLDIMLAAELEARGEVERRLKESILFFEVVVNGEVLGGQGELRVRNLSLAAVLKLQLQLR